MVRVSEPRVENLVVHFKVPENGRQRLLQTPAAENFDASRRNFYVLRLNCREHLQSRPCRRRRRHRSKGGLAFTVFPRGGSVIATGISSFSFIDRALEEFALVTKTGPAGEWYKKVVNSTYSGSVEPADDGDSILRKVAYLKSADKSISISFRSHFFPGILIKWEGTRGSVNLFNNGRYVLVGLSCKEQVAALRQRLCALMTSCWTTTAPAMSCAWTAVSSPTACSATFPEREACSERITRAGGVQS